MSSTGLTHRQGKQCLLCAAALADQSTETDVCRTHREPRTQIVVNTGTGREVLTLTHRRIMPAGHATWVGVGEDGRRVVWSDSVVVGRG